MSRPLLSTVLLLALAGCSNVNLGNIDDSVDAREDMPGPGIFRDAEGKSSLSWSSEDSDPAAAPAPADSTVTPEQAEFEQFKLWNQLRSEGADSAEYQEFLQWLEYRNFKAAQ